MTRTAAIISFLFSPNLLDYILFLLSGSFFNIFAIDIKSDTYEKNLLTHDSAAPHLSDARFRAN